VLHSDAPNSTEFDRGTRYPVIDLMPEQRDIADMGGTMRLGLYPCDLVPGTKAAQAYGVPRVEERHRHRFEFNNAYRDLLSRHGLVLSGLSPDGRLVEIAEIADHPFMVGSQFHPEFKSRPNRPHPLFRAFIAAAVEHERQRAGQAMPILDPTALPKNGQQARELERVKRFRPPHAQGQQTTDNGRERPERVSEELALAVTSSECSQ
ncbi:MAG: hypothetical protein C4310_08610, partial [Chloroflexota bacterium]